MPPELTSRSSTSYATQQHTNDGASVAEGVRKMKDAAIALVNDRNGITPGDCSALVSEIGTYFDRAASAVC